MKRSLQILAVLAAMFFIAIPSASATPPLDDFSTPIIDQADVLNDQEVQFAIQKVEDATEYRLNVVFVDTFDGMTGAMWATTTAEQSGLNASQDIVFAVAVQDRKYGSAYPNGTPLARVITNVEDAALPSLGDDKWTEAVVAYADAVISETSASSDNSAAAPVAPSEPVDFSGFFNVLKFILLSALGATVLAGFAWVGRNVFRIRKAAVALRKEAKAKTSKVSQALIDFDENVKRFGMEIDYFNAEFPEVDLRGARTVLAHTEKELRTAFASSKILDTDSIKDQERLQTANDVLYGIEKAEVGMREHLDKFAALRARAAKVDADVTRITKGLEKVNADLATAEANIVAVEGNYDKSVFAGSRKSLASSRAQSGKVADLLAKAKAFIAAGQSGRALGVLESATSALDAADDVAGQVDAVLNSLRQAPKKAEVLLAQMQDDIDYVKACTLAKTASQRTINGAQAAVAQYRAVDFTTGDPLRKVSDLTAKYKDFNQVANSLRAQEKRIADAIENLPRLADDTLRVISEAVVYSNRHKDVKRTSVGNLGSLEGEVAKAKSITDPLKAHEKVESIRARAQSIMSAMKSDVRKEEARVAKERRDKEEAERKARRDRERRNSSSYGSSYGSTYAYGSYSSSSYSSYDSSSSSFGSSGGDFGGFGGSGGDF